MNSDFEILSLGNELLTGRIVNTNAQWLAKYITSLGGRVRRITVLRDQVDEISAALRGALARRTSFIITTGGLGPTFDDKALEAVADALGEPLEFSEEARHMVEEKYIQYGKASRRRIPLTPARLKMAKLPKGSVPLPNPVGTAPGVLSESGSSRIINLPGVPSEMKAIFEDSVTPLIRGFLRDIAVYEEDLEVRGIIESELSPLIDIVRREIPQVYIKSHPRDAEPTPLLELNLSTSSNTREEAESRVKKAERRISSLIKRLGGSIRSLN